MKPPECLLQSTHPQRDYCCVSKSANTLCGHSRFLCPFFVLFESMRPQALYGAMVSHCTTLLGCRITKIVADLSFFPLLTSFFVQQKIPEEEAIRVALVQVASEKQAAQHEPLLR